MIPSSLALNENFMTPTDDQYHDLIEEVLANGSFKGDRTGTGTKAVVGRMARYNLMNGRSPRLTTKFMSDNPEREMFWFIGGSSSIKELRDQNIGIWNSWLMEGSAQYRDLTQAEIQTALVKHLNVTDFSAIHNPGLPVGEFTIAIDEDDKDRAVFEYADETSWGFAYSRMLNRLPSKLIDGDIGPGGYGPQWRHWKDVQLVSRAQLHAYRQQGYKQLGKVNPPDLPYGVEELTAALDAHLRGKGFASTSIGDADSCMLPERGWEAVGDPTKNECAHVLYLNEDALIDCYVTLLDVPRFVMYREIDQLANAIKLLREDPNSRRIIISAWNPALTWKAALPPCHLYFQFISHELTIEQRYAIARDRVALEKYDIEKAAKSGIVDAALRTWMQYDLEADRKDCTDEDLHANMDTVRIPRRGLYCFLLLRSNDLGLGQPFNVAQYATLTHMVAQCVGMAPLELVWTAVDAHVYTNHVDALNKQLNQSSLDCIPRIKLAKGITEIDDFDISKIVIHDYESHEALTKSMPVAV